MLMHLLLRKRTRFPNAVVRLVLQTRNHWISSHSQVMTWNPVYSVSEQWPLSALTRHCAFAVKVAQCGHPVLGHWSAFTVVMNLQFIRDLRCALPSPTCPEVPLLCSVTNTSTVSVLRALLCGNLQYAKVGKQSSLRVPCQSGSEIKGMEIQPCPPSPRGTRCPLLASGLGGKPLRSRLPLSGCPGLFSSDF